MALFEKGNKIGNRFSSDNQPQNSGRKPSVYKYIKDITGKKVAPEMSKEDYYKVIRFLMESTPETLEGLVKNKDGTPNKKTPVWVLNVVSAITQIFAMVGLIRWIVCLIGFSVSPPNR